MSPLIESVAAELGISLRSSRMLVGLVASAIRDLTEIGEAVRIPGLGTFRVVVKSERQGRNPRTGEPITIPAHNKLTFTEAKSRTK